MIGNRNRTAFNDSIGWPSLDDVIAWIRGNLEPDEVFTEAKLTEWAIDNGYEKED